MELRESASSALLVKVGLLVSKHCKCLRAGLYYLTNITCAVPDESRTMESCDFCDGGKVRGRNGNNSCNGKTLSECCQDANDVCNGSEYGFLGQCEQCLTGKGRTVDVKVCNCLRVSRTTSCSARQYENQGVVRFLRRWKGSRRKRGRQLQW